MGVWIERSRLNQTPRLGLATLAACIALSPSARAYDICEAIALRDVAAIEAADSIIPKGGRDTAITQYRVEKQTKRTSFCSHGGYCYPTHVFIGGERVEALRLTNCKIGKKSDFDGPDETTYEVNVDRSKVSPEELRRYDLEDKLLQMGLCSACASNVATLYLDQPQSRCAKLTRRALDGDPKAASVLSDLPKFCEVR